jgi:hypothetical protein
MKRKLFLSLLVVGLLGALAGFGAFSAFTSTTANPGNSFAAGTVALGDNDAGAAFYSLSNQKPGSSTTKCIKVTYTGTLDADVKLYTTSSIGSLGQYVDLTITPGTQPTSTFPDCTSFTPDAGGAIFNNTLQNFATNHASYATGLSDYPGSSTKWVTNDAVVYRFVLTLQSGTPDSAQGGSTGAHSFTWEARNQ